MPPSASSRQVRSGTGSPPMNRRGTAAPVSCSRSSCQCEGVRSRSVTACSASSAASRAGSARRASSTTTRVSPRQIRIHCWTEASKETLAFQATTDGSGR